MLDGHILRKTLFVILAFGALAIPYRRFNAVRVPRILVWVHPNVTLPPQAARAVASWNDNPLIVNDTECAILAKKHHCGAYFRTDLMNIIRADACRYMALYEHGGIYTDLDVMQRAPYNRLCKGLCVARESKDSRTIGNYFIAADANDTCLLRAIRACCANMQTVSIDFKREPHLVHKTCGPDAFTDAVKDCASEIMPRATLDKYALHIVASNLWKSQSYPSWLEERKKMAGWRHVYEH